jgi:hypothetical protein
VTSTELENFAPTLDRKGKVERYVFPGVIEIESLEKSKPFARAGDSGSLVLTKPDLRPIGIHFCSSPIAGQPSRNYLMPIDRICDMLKVTLINGASA